MSKTRTLSEERRTKLFHDRPYIYGRVPKFVPAYAFSMTFWAPYYIYHRMKNAQ